MHCDHGRGEFSDCPPLAKREAWVIQEGNLKREKPGQGERNWQAGDGAAERLREHGETLSDTASG